MKQVIENIVKIPALLRMGENTIPIFDGELERVFKKNLTQRGTVWVRFGASPKLHLHSIIDSQGSIIEFRVLGKRRESLRFLSVFYDFVEMECEFKIVHGATLEKILDFTSEWRDKESKLFRRFLLNYPSETIITGEIMAEYFDKH